MTPIFAIGAYHPSVDDAVIQAAESLDIPVPDDIRLANAVFGLVNLGMDSTTLEDLPQDWPDTLNAWRLTSDYVRACVAAFDSR